jgi:hypothetical protein
MYRLATTDDMMADVLREGHVAHVRRYDWQTESVVTIEEWLMPTTERMTYRCGHQALGSWETDEEGIDEIAENLASNSIDYASVWDWIADVCTTRCANCHEAAFDRQTAMLENSLILPSHPERGG